MWYAKIVKIFMTAIELLRICDKILKSMSEIGLRISDWLEALGAGRKEIEHACNTILKENKGFTYSNPDLRMSLMCISRVTSIDQWFDSMTHEVDHLQWEIMQYYDVDPGTEDAAWLQGYIVRMIIKAIAR